MINPIQTNVNSITATTRLSHRIIISTVIATLYSFILAYFYQPLEFIVLTFAVVNILILSNQQSFKYITSVPIYAWLLLYLVIHLIWMILPNSYATPQDMRKVILSVIVLFSIVSLLYFDTRELLITRRIILILVILASVINIYEFFNPDAFQRSHLFGRKIMGRSAGFYLNANNSGQAIIIGLIFSYSLVTRSLKVPFLLLTLLGVFFTFSRASLLTWFLVVAALSFTGIITKKTGATILATLVVGASILIPIVINLVEINFESATSNILDRLNFFSSKDVVLDESAAIRLEIAQSAWNSFLNNPLIGEGLSYTKHWVYDVSTHNTYLILMAELGIIGLFLYPLLILSSIWKAKNEAKKLSLAFVGYYFLVGFFSHNTLDSYHFLIGLAMMASLSYKSNQVDDSPTLIKTS